MQIVSMRHESNLLNINAAIQGARRKLKYLSSRSLVLCDRGGKLRDECDLDDDGCCAGAGFSIFSRCVAPAEPIFHVEGVSRVDLVG
jgi:hypothetical protein